MEKACNDVNIQVGLQPIELLNQEIENRWAVMTQVVEEKQRSLEDTQKKLSRYHSALNQVRSLLNQVEEALESQEGLGADADQAKVNRETLKVDGISLLFFFFFFSYQYKHFNASQPAKEI